MKNGLFHETGKVAPETGIGTGALVPLIDEVEAATVTPSVDETTAGKGKNKPRQAEASDIKVSGEALADPASKLKSTGEELEVRDNPNAHALDSQVNKNADETIPAAPQAPRPTSRRAGKSA